MHAFYCQYHYSVCTIMLRLFAKKLICGFGGLRYNHSLPFTDSESLMPFTESLDFLLLVLLWTIFNIRHIPVLLVYAPARHRLQVVAPATWMDIDSPRSFMCSRIPRSAHSKADHALVFLFVFRLSLLFNVSHSFDGPCHESESCADIWKFRSQ